MNNTAYHINGLAKDSLAISDAEWAKVLSVLIREDYDLYDKLVSVKVSVALLRKSLDFKEEAEEVAELYEVTA